MITLGVKDLEKSRAFYADGLGWEPSSDSNDDIVFIPLNGFSLALYKHDALAKDATVMADRSTSRGFTLAHNMSNRKQVDEVMDFAKRAGAKIVKPAKEVFWGGYSGYFADPDGFLWEVAHNPALEP